MVEFKSTRSGKMGENKPKKESKKDSKTDKQKDLEEMKETLQRLQAEFENYKK